MSDLSASAQALLELIQKLPKSTQKALGRKAQDRDFVFRMREARAERAANNYTVHLDANRAKRDAGGHVSKELLIASVERKLEEHSANSVLSAEYVREFIRDVLELCPTDYFILADDGEWAIDPQSFAKLPSKIKRCVESCEVRTTRMGTYVSVKFISKTAALAMASRYTLVSKLTLNEKPQLPWDTIAKAIEAPPNIDEEAYSGLPTPQPRIVDDTSRELPDMPSSEVA